MCFCFHFIFWFPPKLKSRQSVFYLFFLFFFYPPKSLLVWLNWNPIFILVTSHCLLFVDWWTKFQLPSTLLWRQMSLENELSTEGRSSWSHEVKSIFNPPPSVCFWPMTIFSHTLIKDVSLLGMVIIQGYLLSLIEGSQHFDHLMVPKLIGSHFHPYILHTNYYYITGLDGIFVSILIIN